jgi:hypothetical protein
MRLTNQARIETEICRMDLAKVHDILFAPELLEKY